MNKTMAIVLLVVGAVLLVVGFNASESETSKALTGSPTDKALWFMIGGGAAALIGVIGLMRRPKTA
jgi:hypothetical protein